MVWAFFHKKFVAETVCVEPFDGFHLVVDVWSDNLKWNNQIPMVIAIFAVLFSGCYLLNLVFLSLFGFYCVLSDDFGHYATWCALPENDINC
ncbi:MAG: hypothetical protein KAJ24_01160 [Candidatus Aenigmarchaeota archaeon]|nr:hypothetical protein [Candidatus Aenigmarchaeota archaeon]